MRSHQPQNAQQPRYIEPKPHKYTTKLTTHDTQNTLHQSVNVICTLLFLLALLHFQFGLRQWLGLKVKTNFNSNGNNKKHKNCSCNSSDNNNNNKRTRIYTHVFFVKSRFWAQVNSRIKIYLWDCWTNNESKCLKKDEIRCYCFGRQGKKSENVSFRWKMDNNSEQEHEKNCRFLKAIKTKARLC